MAKNKGTKSGSPSTMGDKGPNQGSGMENPGEQPSGSQGNFDDDKVTKAGGREGKFSDSESSGEGQWSPGSNVESDR